MYTGKGLIMIMANSIDEKNNDDCDYYPETVHTKRDGCTDETEEAKQSLCQGVRRFEKFEFLSEKINFTALGGSKSSSFEPDTSHP